MKFLIIRFSSIGDIVLTTPVIRCLKQQVPNARVHYLTRDTYAPLFAAQPYVDKMHYLSDQLEDLLPSLQQEDFDYIIDLHHNLRTARVKRALGKPVYAFDKLNLRKWLLTAFKINTLPPLHIVDRYLETVAGFGVRNDGKGLDYFIPDAERVPESDIPTAHLAGYIAVVIGAALGTKKYPKEKLAAFCRGISHPVMLLGGPEDAAEGKELAAADPFKIYNACGKFTLNESADLIRRSKLVISNDTGLMHIAAAFGKPLISLWGNTVPAFGMYPYYGQNRLAGLAGRLPYDVLEIKKLYCRPCSKIGYRRCPLGHFRCMEKIEAETVLEHTRLRLNA